MTREPHAPLPPHSPLPLSRPPTTSSLHIPNMRALGRDTSESVTVPLGKSQSGSVGNTVQKKPVDAHMIYASTPPVFFGTVQPMLVSREMPRITPDVKPFQKPFTTDQRVDGQIVNVANGEQALHGQEFGAHAMNGYVEGLHGGRIKNAGSIGKVMGTPADIERRRIQMIPAIGYVASKQFGSNKGETEQSGVACHECGTKFKNNQNKNRHWIVVHQNKQPYQCTLCTASYGLRGGLHLHYKAAHKEYFNKMQKAKTGKGSSPQNGSRVQPLMNLRPQKVIGKSLTCIKCGASFPDRVLLNLHNSAVHPSQPSQNNPSHFCRVCNKSFTSGQQLLVHITAGYCTGRADNTPKHDGNFIPTNALNGHREISPSGTNGAKPFVLSSATDAYLSSNRPVAPDLRPGSNLNIEKDRAANGTSPGAQIKPQGDVRLYENAGINGYVTRDGSLVTRSIASLTGAHNLRGEVPSAKPVKVPGCKCLECDTSGNFSQHSDTMLRKQCEICSQHFMDHQSLTVHKKRVHSLITESPWTNKSQVANFPCALCDMNFRSSANLRHHESLVHDKRNTSIYP